MNSQLPRHQTSTMMKKLLTSLRYVLRLSLLSLLLPISSFADDQVVYPTAQAAVQALSEALKSDNEAALLDVIGKTHRNLVVTGNPQEDAASRSELAQALHRYHYLQEAGPDKRLLLVGPQAWPLPIPLVRQGSGWRFATEEGAQELLNRRIGANERNAIYVLQTYLDAQQDYAAHDRNGDGVLAYAQKLLSSPGKQDGLYWPSEDNAKEPSPFGPLIAASTGSVAGYAGGAPFHGYYFRVLTAQGKDAAGGAFNYIINGKLLAGFGLVAYPATWGETGVMTFIINRNGKIYQKDLGAKSVSLGAKMRLFNPGPGWKELLPP